MQAPTRVPTCISLILADHVYQIANSERLIIVGAFHQIAAPAFPCIRPEIAVVFGLTEGEGTYNLSVSLEEAESGHVAARINQKVRLPNPIHLQDIFGTMNGVIFQRPGRYWATLRADERILAQRPFMLNVLPPPSHE